jgi:sec-independent protein translocase protein TatB
MIDLGISKLALIGAVALIVIGPEKLPRVARTVGALLGKAQRYVADVKAEVNRSMDLDELKKMKDSVEGAMRDVQNSVQTTAADVQNSLSDQSEYASSRGASAPDDYVFYPVYQHPRKKWRTKVSAMPNWYKARNGVRSKAQSGAARVAKYRPAKFD